MGWGHLLSLFHSQVEKEGQMFEDPFFRQAVWMAGGDVTDREDEDTAGCMCGDLAFWAPSERLSREIARLILLTAL